MADHALVDNTLVMERYPNGSPIGIRATCVCGWTSGGHFSSFAASATFREHAENMAAGARTVRRDLGCRSND